MEKEEYRKHYELEEDFWWFRGRRSIIQEILQLHSLAGQKLKILDAGCGTGFNLKFFERYGTAYGCDFSQSALDFCQKRGLKRIVQADVEQLPFASQSFDLVTLLDVLYHKNIRSDVQVLREVGQVLKKGGYLLLTDSAFNFLRSKHDIAFHARERYRKVTLRRRLEKSGFCLLKASYFNLFLFLIVLLVRFSTNIFEGKGQKAQSDLKSIDKTLNSLLYRILKFEAFLIKYINLPFGSSIFCLAQKK